MKPYCAAVILILLLAGCSLNQQGPIAPELSTAAIEPHDNHMLWGEWTFYINADHTRIDITPRRQGRFHLNALKFLEEYCTDCVEITNIISNGDGTINLTVRITHPFPDHPQYTGFDVKGIIMFNGSHFVPWWSSLVYPYGEYNDPHYFYISWAEAGDPEVLNQDGYTVCWSPWWDSGSTMPIFIQLLGGKIRQRNPHSEHQRVYKLLHG